MFDYKISELIELAHGNAVNKGWHETERPIPESLCLIHSELSEALEELRNGHGPNDIYFNDKKPEGFGIELADTVIRIFDLCGQLNINLEKALQLKMEYNTTRPHKHGKVL